MVTCMPIDKSKILSGIASHIANNLSGNYQKNYGLLGGAMGNVIFLYYYSQIDHSYEHIADELLDSILRKQDKRIFSYCNGLSGLGLGLMALENDGFVSGAINSLEDYDRVLNGELRIELRANKHDFLHGFIGLGFYFLERYCLGYGHNLSSLLEIVDYLYSNAGFTDNGVRWKLNEKSTGIYNISLSHGMSSTVILLCRIYKFVKLDDKYKNKIKELITQSVKYILNQKQSPETNRSYFPSTSLDCSSGSYSRLGWCYGDLGIAICLLNAGSVLEELDIYNTGVEVLKYNAACRRNFKQDQVYDACICHGASGIALIYEFMYAKTRDAVFNDAAKYWSNIVLRSARKTSEGYAYRFFGGRDSGYIERFSILDGSAGVGLYLMGLYRTPLSKLLLLDIL